MQIHHGTADGTCPVRWSEATAAALPDAALFEYPGEQHRFDASWRLFMRRAVAFLKARL